MMLLTGSLVKGVEVVGITQEVARERQRTVLLEAERRRLVGEARRGRRAADTTSRTIHLDAASTPRTVRLDAASTPRTIRLDAGPLEDAAPRTKEAAPC